MRVKENRSETTEEQPLRLVSWFLDEIFKEDVLNSSQIKLLTITEGVRGMHYIIFSCCHVVF